MLLHYRYRCCLYVGALSLLSLAMTPQDEIGWYRQRGTIRQEELRRRWLGSMTHNTSNSTSEQTKERVAQLWPAQIWPIFHSNIQTSSSDGVLFAVCAPTDVLVAFQASEQSRAWEETLSEPSKQSHLQLMFPVARFLLVSVLVLATVLDLCKYSKLPVSIYVV